MTVQVMGRCLAQMVRMWPVEAAEGRIELQ